MNDLIGRGKLIPWTEQLGLVNFRDLLAEIGHSEMIPKIECILMSPILGCSPDEFKKEHNLKEYESPMDYVWFYEYNIFKIIEEDFCNIVKRFQYVLDGDLLYDMAVAAALRYELWGTLDMTQINNAWMTSLGYSPTELEELRKKVEKLIGKDKNE